MDDLNLGQSVINERNSIAKQIRIYREKNGYSQDTLAEIMGVSRSTISKIENGKFSFSIDYLSRLSFFLGFKIMLSDNELP